MPTLTSDEHVWESHKQLLETKYLGEDLSLQQVMSFMEGEHGFVAKKNQYEKYLVQKWKFRKNVKSTKWKAIYPVVCRLEQLGQPFNVWIDGEKKSAATVRKETRRYTRLTLGSSVLALEQKLPPGVTIQTACPHPVPIDIFELPFHSFERNVRNRLPISSSKKQPDVLAFNHARISDSLDGSNPDSALIAALGVVVVPLQEDLGGSVNQSLRAPNTQPFASLLLRNILFSVANNFAGIGTLPKAKVLKFLQRETSYGLRWLLFSAPDHYTAQALALNLFRASIEAGDAQMVDLLLRQPLLGSQVNSIVCHHDGSKYTPIERAAALLDSKVIRVLLEHGADVNSSLEPSSLIGPGALNCAARNPAVKGEPSIRLAQLDPEVFQLLVESGGQLEEEVLWKLIRLDVDGKLVHQLISRDAVYKYEEWSSAGMFIQIFKHQNHRILVEVLKLMLQIGADINQWLSNTPNNSERSIIDAVARRGDTFMVNNLLNVGAKVTSDTLFWATSSGSITLVQDLILNHGAMSDVKCTPRISPLAVAIRLQHPGMISLLTSHGALQSLTDRELLLSALLAASHVGDLTWVERLVGFDGGSEPKVLGLALINAIIEGKEDVVVFLIDAGADTNLDGGRFPKDFLDKSFCNCSMQDGPPIREALIRRHAGLVHHLLTAGASMGYRARPAIQLAVEWGDRSIVEAVIEAGAVLNVSIIDYGMPALCIAVHTQDKDMVTLLLDAGCDINDPEARTQGHTALGAAVKSGNIDMVNYVLDHGADPHDPPAFGKSIEQGSAILDLLLQKHAARYPQGRKNWGGELLHKAIEANNLQLFKHFLRSGADPNHISKTVKMTPFGHAVTFSNGVRNDFVELLLQQKQITRCTPETVMSIMSGTRFVLSFTRFPGQQEVENWVHLTAFLAAIGTGCLSTVKLMLRHGADVNFPARSRIKRTPLQRAAEQGNIEMVTFLLSSGADVNGAAARTGGGTALQLAAIGGYIPLVRVLLEHGGDLHVPPSKIDGRSALEGAAEHGRLDMVTVLLKAGAGNGGKNYPEFKRAITLAEENGYGYIADLLTHYFVRGKLSIRPTPLEDYLDPGMIEQSM
ncbi:MAG: hypothetical protein Q9182_004815 [Xanthomendoza sp. 2 TL-2023]